MMKTGALLLALTAVLAFAAPANAADQAGVRADLNGDGLLDEVTATLVAGNPEQQLLTATVRGARLTAVAPLNSHLGILPLRVVDLDGDGRDEVVVTESAGANTVSFGVWGLFSGLRPVTGTDGQALKLWEGGGMSARNGYGCEQADGTRLLVTVASRLTDWKESIYTGERVTYSVEGGVAFETSRIPVAGPWDAPGLQVNPQACA